MPFIRHTRDKRGYETTYVMHAYRAPANQGRTRVLYFFRTAAHLRVGRRPLDEETREALQHTHPDLSFDWFSLGREAQPNRVDEREARAPRRERERQGQRSQGRRDRPAPATAEPAVPKDDDSVLGRALGASAAGRLRERYAALQQRIERRARTPEERDRLTERVQRLNPDGWEDEAAARTGAAGVEAEWDEIALSLPQRRRGRRGGRRADGPDAGTPPGEHAGDRPSSEIIGSEGDTNELPEDVAADRARGSAGHPDDRDGRGPVSADTPAGGDIPLSDQLRHD